MRERELIRCPVVRGESRRTNLVVALYRPRGKRISLLTLQLAAQSGNISSSVVGAVGIVGILRLLASLQVARESGFRHRSGVGRCEHRVLRPGCAIHSDAVARRPHDSHHAVVRRVAHAGACGNSVVDTCQYRDIAFCAVNRQFVVASAQAYHACCQCRASEAAAVDFTVHLLSSCF